MGNLYVSNPGDSDGASRWREERERTLRLVRSRWTSRLAERLDLSIERAEQVVALLFDHANDAGEACACGCHPRFDTLHDGGFSCPCTQAAEERKRAREQLFAAFEPSEDMLAAEQVENAELAVWLAAHPSVTAERTCFAAPEVWEGTVDGRTFYFRERHGEWRIELDLEPNSTFANRWVGTDADGEMITEPVKLTSGHVIADGVDTALGDSAVAHLDFIYRRIRRHLRQQSCGHPDARLFCPDCGAPAGDE